MLARTFVILGPTCTGKTSLAINLCKRFKGIIVSADSRQVVRYMDIGTGKVPVVEDGRCVEKQADRWVVDGVDIFGYDLVNPDEYFSAYDFVNYCQEVLPKVSPDVQNVFLVGGTGFYIDAVTGNTPLAGVGPNTELRRSLENLSTEALAEKLSKLDESVYKRTDIKNPARLVRAIEKASQIVDSSKSLPVIEEVAYIGLTAAREVLYSRADAWVGTVFSERLFEEVRLLQERFPKSHRLNGLIYKSAINYLIGVENLDEAKQKAKFNMHAYIRRQQTWFKRELEIKWFDIEDKNFDSRVSSIVQSLANG